MNLRGLRSTYGLIWLAVVLVSGLSAWVIHFHRDSERETQLAEESAELERFAQAAVSGLNRNLATIDLLFVSQAKSVQAAHRRDGSLDAHALGESLRDAVDRQLLVRDLALIDPQGRVLAAAQSSTVRLGTALPDAYLAAVRSQPIPELHFGDAVVIPATGEYSIWLLRPMQIGANGYFMLAELPVALLSGMLAQGMGGKSWTLTLERTDGSLLATVPARDTRLGERIVPALSATDLDGRAHQAPGRLAPELNLRVAHPTLVPDVALSAGVSHAAVLAAADASHSEDRWFPVAVMALMMGLGVVLQRYLEQQARDRRLLEAARAETAREHAELQAQVTAREAADAERQRTEKRLADLLANTEEGFWHIDSAGRTLEVNPAMCRLLGREAADVLDHNVFDFVDAENAEVFRAQLQLRRGGVRGPYEIRLQRPDGSTVACINNATPLYNDAGEQLGSIGLWTNISEMKRAQDELALAKSVLDRALDAMAEGFVLFDANQRLLAWNRRYVELFPYLAGRLEVGMSMEAVAELAVAHLLPHASLHEREAYKARRTAERERSSGTNEMRQIDGRFVESVDRTTRDGLLLSVFRDVTELRATHRALAAARDAAEAAARTKTQFLASMSHEIRTPLNAVLGMNGLLQGTPLNADQRRYVDLIAKSGESLLAVINDILDLSRLESGKMTLELVDFSVHSAINDVISMMKDRARARSLDLNLTLDDNDAELRMRGDPSRLRQVLFNLVGNAIKFTDNGHVDVDVKSSAADEQSVVWCIAIRDTGIGIAPNALPRLFERFSQADGSTSRRFGGTGLGLAISREIVQLMGGRIDVASEVGKGSTFTVWLTLERARSTDATAEPAPVFAPLVPGAHNASALKILVAEDYSANQVLIRALLARMGHQADVVGDGLEALRQVQAVPYDVVLMDVQMPDMDGLAATRAIRALPGPVSRIPIIALTANVMAEDREACVEAGMNAFVGKPIAPAALQQALDQVLGVQPA